VRGAQCLAGWLLCLADTTAQSTQPERRRAQREGSRQLPCERPDLRRQACVARPAGGRDVVAIVEAAACHVPPVRRDEFFSDVVARLRPLDEPDYANVRAATAAALTLYAERNK
jgi:hypothetical protein